jgi:hypothetical protein
MLLFRINPGDFCHYLKLYVYLTYSIKNTEKEETKILLESYRDLLQKALGWL